MPRVTAGLLVAFLILSGGARAEDAAGEPAPDYARDGFYAGMNFMYGSPFFEEHLENRPIAPDTVRAGGKQGGGLPVQDFPLHAFLDVDPSVGFLARVGYRFLSHFAVELQFEWLDEFDVAIGLPGLADIPPADVTRRRAGGLVEGVSGAVDRSTIDAFTVTGNLKIFPLKGRVQPYVDVGVGYMEVDSRDTSSIVTATWDAFFGFRTSEASIGVNLNENDLVARFGGGVDLYINERWGVNAAAAYVTPAGDLKKFNYVSLNGGFFYRFP